MKILILEDNVERQKQFQKNLIGNTIVIVEHAIHAINYLQNENWNVLFLDHDLGGEIHVSSEDKNTGSEVARWLSNNKKRQPKLIILHSLNAPGRKYMKGILPKSVSLPFAWTHVTTENLTKENISELKELAKKQIDRMII